MNTFSFQNIIRGTVVAVALTSFSVISAFAFSSDTQKGFSASVVEVEVSANKLSFTGGEELRFSLDIANASKGTLSEKVTFAYDARAFGEFSDFSHPCSVSRGTITCFVSDVIPGQTDQVTFSARVRSSSPLGNVNIGAGVAGASDQQSLTILGGATGPSCAVAASSDTVVVGDAFEFNYEIDYGSAPVGATGVRGDINGDGAINIVDQMEIFPLFYSFTTEETESADLNDDGRINILDLTAFINITSEAGEILPGVGNVNDGSHVADSSSFSGATAFTLLTKNAGNGEAACATEEITFLFAPEVEDQSFTVEENALVGSEVGQVVANDPDSLNALAFEIESGNEGNVFSIGSDTGVLVVNGDVDFESAPEYALAIVVTDGDGNTGSAVMTVEVMGVNEAPVANDDTGIGQINTPFRMNVFANDADPDEGDELRFEQADISQNFVNGILIANFNADGTSAQPGDAEYGTILVFPNEGYVGTDSTNVYSMKDLQGLSSNTAVIIYTIEGLPPQVRNRNYAEFYAQLKQLVQRRASTVEISQFLVANKSVWSATTK